MSLLAPIIPGYTVLDKISEGSSGVVFRAERAGKIFAIKVIPKGRLQSSSEIRFKKEVAALSRVRHPKIIRIHDAGHTEAFFYTVTELVDGAPLSHHLRGSALENERLVQLAKDLAEALACIEGIGLVHRDIKPDNILINQAGQAVLIDFGFVLEQKEYTAPADLIGTAYYASPEQLGALKRPIDHRSDLYSLGCVLYEAATGQKPIEGQSLLEVIDGHLRTKPGSPRQVNSNTHPVLSHVIERLISKEPEQRYQSAQSLLADLNKLEQLAVTLDKDGSVALDLPENRYRPEQAQRIFGRDREIKLLENTWEDVLRGSGRIVLVEGESGCGKTSLCQTFYSRLHPIPANIRVRCHENRSAPYGIFLDLVNRILLGRIVENSDLNGLVQKAAKGIEPYLLQILPDLESVLDERFKGVLTGDEDKDLYYSAISEFLVRLADLIHQPLVIHIDDIQWADQRSLEALFRISKRISKTKILILATARDDKKHRHIVELFINNAVFEAGLRLVLAPLDGAAIHKIIETDISINPVDSDLVEYILQFTHGNPYMVKECLQLLLENGILRLSDGNWLFDKKNLSLLPLPQNIVALMQDRLSTVRRETLKFLRMAAGIGMIFSKELMVDLSGDPQQLESALQEALSSQLLFIGDQGMFEFPHDSIREALYGGLGEADRQELHSKIAEAMDRSEEASPFDLAFHYREAGPQKNPARTFQTNMHAGELALTACSHDEAEKCLETCLELTSVFKVERQDSFRLHVLLGRLYRLKGRTQEAVDFYNRAITHIDDSVERARVHGRLLEIYVGMAYFENRNPLAEAHRELASGLKTLGAFIPRSGIIHLVFALATWPFALLIEKLNIQFTSLSPERRQRLEVLSDLFSAGVRLCFSSSQDLQMFALALRNYLCARILGPCHHSVRAYVYYAGMVGYLGFKKYALRLEKESIEMAKNLNDRSFLAETHIDIGVQAFFDGRLDQAMKSWQYAIHEDANWLSTDYFVAACKLQTDPMYCTGDISALKEVASCRDAFLAERQFSSLSIDCDVLNEGLLQSVFRGAFSEARQRQIQLLEQMRNVKFIPHIQLAGYWALLMGFIENPELEPRHLDEILKAFKNLKQGPLSSNVDIKRIFSGIACARLVQYVRSDFEPRILRRLRRDLRAARMASWEGFSKGLYWYTRGKLDRIENRIKSARKNLLRAERFADPTKNYWLIYEIALERARIEKGQGFHTIAEQYAKQAIIVAEQMHWPEKRNLVRREFDISATEFERMALSTETLNLSGVLSSRYSEALLRVSLASTSSLNPETQAREALDELNRVLNAERAFLFLLNPVTDQLEFRCGRDFRGRDIDFIDSYSSTVIEKVKTSKSSMIVDNLGEETSLASKSIVAHNLKSIMACPLIIRDRFLGVVYTDSTVAKGLFSKDDLEIFNGISRHIAIAIETSQMANIEAERRTLKKDLEVSAAVQSLFLPTSFTIQTAFVSGLGFYRPATECGGDWWWHRQEDDGGISIVVGDVTGHGAGAAMITASVASYFQTLVAENPETDIPTLFKKSSRLLNQLARGKYMMTAFGIRIDPISRVLRYWNAGAPPGLCLSPNSSGEIFGERGNPLGFTDFSIGEGELPLRGDERIFLSTDGAFEVTAESGRTMGPKQVMSFLQKGQSRSREEISNELLNKLDLIQGNAQDDDFTWVILDVRFTNAEKRRRSA